MVLICEEVMFLFYILMMAMFFMGIITYYWWPTRQEQEYKRLQSLSAIHGRKDWHKKAIKANINEKDTIFKKKGLILAVWVVLFAILYIFTMYKTDNVEYNPYEVLGVFSNSNLTAIKSKYRELSKVFHPDKGGNEESFIRIKQAYEALTNPESNKNWQLYGHPDGKQVVEFGIAFPKALMKSANWFKISMLYLIGLFSFGYVVKTKFQEKEHDDSSNKVNMITENIYTKEILKLQKIDELSDIIEIFSFAVDFNDVFNPDIRKLSNEVWLGLEGLAEALTYNFDIKVWNRNAPEDDLFGRPYTAKTRMMLYSHLVGINGGLTAEQEEDRDYVLKKSPLLLDKMVNVFGKASMIGTTMLREPISLSIITLQKIIDLSQLTIQGHLHNDFPLLQLPHIDGITARFCAFGQKDPIATPKALACVPEDQRRKFLHKLDDNEYEEAMKVLKNVPYIQIEVDASVLGEEIINTNDLITVNIKLSRTSLSKFMDNTNIGKVTKKDKTLVAPKDVDSQKDFDFFIENYKANYENKKAKHRKMIEVKAHTVYSRNFPQEKTEGWWVFIEDKKNEKLELTSGSPPICKLDGIGEDDEIELQFIAPEAAGKHTYVVWCRSDSMYGCDASVELELFVNKNEDVENIEEDDIEVIAAVEDVASEEEFKVVESEEVASNLEEENLD